MKQDSSLPDALARIRVDRRERDAGYTMSHHHCHNHYELVCIERIPTIPSAPTCAAGSISARPISARS